MELDDELRLIAESAVVHGDPGEDLAGVVPTEPVPGTRLYLCAFGADGATSSWLVLDRAGEPVGDRNSVRDAVSIAALCELAEEAAGTETDDARVASPALLDELGATGGPEVAAAVGGASEAVAELVADVERGYKLALS